MKNIVVEELKDIQTELQQIIADLKTDKNDDINYIRQMNKYLINSNDNKDRLIKKVTSLLHFVVNKEDICNIK